MPLSLMAVEDMPVPRDTMLLLVCASPDCLDWNVYRGGGYIAMRGQAQAEGWRRRANDWWKGACAPKGKDEDG